MNFAGPRCEACVQPTETRAHLTHGSGMATSLEKQAEFLRQFSQAKAKAQEAQKPLPVPFSRRIQADEIEGEFTAITLAYLQLGGNGEGLAWKVCEVCSHDNNKQTWPSSTSSLMQDVPARKQLAIARDVIDRLTCMNRAKFVLKDDSLCRSCLLLCQLANYVFTRLLSA